MTHQHRPAPTNPARRRARFWQAVSAHWLALVGYTLVALVVTYPLAFVGPHAIAGTAIAEKDGWQKIWDMWWFRHSLLYGGDPFHTVYLYWSLGVNLLVYQTYALTTLLISLPALLPFGPVAGYKFSMIMNFALSGYTMCLLARHYTRQWLPALVAGLLFLAAPVHLARFADGSHLNAMQWLPLYLLALALWLEQGRRWQGAAALALLVVLFFTSLYYTQFALVWTAAAGLVYALATRKPLAVLARTGLLLGGWALLCAPVLLQSLGGELEYRDWLFRQRLRSLDLIDLLLPSDVHPLWGQFALHRFSHPFGSWNVVPGVGILLVGLYGLWRARARLWPWALLALLMVLFAFGPVLHVADHNTGLPMPHALLNLTDAGRGSNRPGHFLIMAIVVLTLGVALALQGRRPRTVLAVGALLFALDCLPPLPWPTITTQPPPWLAALEELPPGALVQVPFQHREVDYQRAQLWHGRPITGGYVSRTPPDPVMQLAPLNQLTGGGSPTLLGGDAATHLRSALGGLCAAGLLVHATPANPEALPLPAVQAQVAALLPEATLLHVGDPLIYRLPALPPQPLLLPGAGWYNLEQDGLRRWQWTAPRATVRLVNPLAAPLAVRVAVEARTAAPAQPVQIWHDDALLWQGTLGLEPTRRTYWLRLPARQQTTLTFVTDGVPEGGSGSRMLGLVFTRLEARAALPQEPAAACPPALALPPALR